MGKRELFIAIAFVTVGMLAYQLTAPPAKADGGFSFRELWNKVREEIREDSANASVTHRETLPVPADVKELRLTEIPRGSRILGEDRPDLAYELAVQSTGPTPEAALDYAKKTKIIRDDLPGGISLRVYYPDEGSQTAQLVIRVPSRLEVRLQSLRNIEISAVAALRFESVLGETKVTRIAGPVTGVYNGGDLEIRDAGSISLRLLNTQARFTNISGGVTIDGRSGELDITSSKGAIEIDSVNGEITIATHDGPIRIGGSGGRVEIDRPTAETRVDMRRAEIHVVSGAAVPLTLVTSDEPITVRFDRDPTVALDVVATDARIDASAFALTGDASGDAQRLTHLFVPGATTRVSLRNLRGDIVIGKVK